MQKKGSKSLPQLKKELDKWFSLYIRQRDADDNGIVACYTCGVYKYWKDMHCGHFISRRHTCTRWDEVNCQVQCVGCNIFNQGNAPRFAQRIVNNYGEKKLNELLELSNNTCKFTRSDYLELIDKYKNKLKWN